MAIVIALLVIIVVIWGWNWYNRIRAQKIVTYLSNEELERKKRRAQIIDLREARDFDAGHILGARNIPYSTLKTFYQRIRPDLPVFLYDQGRTISMRAAFFLSKHGYHDLFILKGGYRNWNGKTKKRDA